MTIQKRLILSGIATIMVGGFVFSQIFIHNKNRRELRDIARELAYSWKEKLHLTTQQTSMLEDIIIAFTIRKNEIINSNIPYAVKIKKLQQIQVKEHKSLRKFLSDTEFEEYIGTNKKIPNPIMDSLLLE